MCDSSRVDMVRALLRPYEYRAWAQSNWVLVRIWQGCGFAFRYHKSPHLLRKHGPRLLQEHFSLLSQSLSMWFFLVVTCYERVIYHWSSKVQRWPVHIINIVKLATAISSSRSFIFLLLFWQFEQTKAVVFRGSEPVMYAWNTMLQMNVWPNFSHLLFEWWISVRFVFTCEILSKMAAWQFFCEFLSAKLFDSGFWQLLTIFIRTLFIVIVFK